MGLCEKLIYCVILVSEIIGIFIGELYEGFEGDFNKLYIRISNEKCLLFYMELVFKN